jgi:tryptophan-rich sensory protein
MDSHVLFGLFGFVGLCFVAASSGAIFRPGDWYEALAKPWWRPPNWLFPPAWSVLYVTIAVAGWLVWRQAGFAGAPLPLAVYFVSLLLNAGWSACFFGLRRPDLAFGEVSLLWLSIVATIAVFAPVDNTAAWLLVPYLCWVSFAATLNFTIWQMNKPFPSRASLQ